MDQFVASTVTAVGLSIDPNSLKSLFDDLGVEKPSDVDLLCEADLTGFLKTVHARKVIAYFKSLDSIWMGLYLNAVDKQTCRSTTCMCLAPVPSESVGVCVGTSDIVIARPVCTVTLHLRVDAYHHVIIFHCIALVKVWKQLSVMENIYKLGTVLNYWMPYIWMLQSLRCKSAVYYCLPFLLPVGASVTYSWGK